MGTVNVDHIWRTVGPLGKYQFKQQASYLLSLITWAFHGLNIVFIGNRPAFHCKPSQNDTLHSNLTGIDNDYKQCNIIRYTNTSDGLLEESAVCYVWEYESPADRSFVTEWNFVCQYAELGELTQVLYQVGMMVGTFIFPTLSDRFGRKPVMVICQVIVFAVSLATAFSENYVVFVILRVLTGLFQQGLLAGTTLSLETFPTEIRHYCAVWGLLSWTTCIALMSPIAYALRNYPWKYLQITYAMCSAWSLIQWWMMDESLCWLIANDKIEQAKKVVKNACRWNRKNYKDVMEEIGWADLVDGDVKSLVKTKKDALEPKKEKLRNSYDETNELNMNDFFQQISGMDYSKTGQKDADVTNGDTVLESLIGYKSGMGTSVHDKRQARGHKVENHVQKFTIFDIFKHKQILIVSIILWYTWVCDSFVYFGLYLSSSSLYGDRFINFFLSALVEYPASFLQYFSLASIGRKWTAVIGHLIAAVGLATATALTYTAGDNTGMLTAATAFILLGKCGITMGYNTVYLATPELYPTNMRNIGLGVCSFMEKVGSMIAPFSRNVSEKIQWLPSCVFAAMCFITVILFAFVPETNGVELPQRMEELTEWYQVNKFELKMGKNRLAAQKENTKDTRL